MPSASKVKAWLDNRDFLLVLVPVCLLALFARMFRIDTIGFSGDQALYAGQAAGLAGFQGYSQFFAPVSRGFTNFLLFQSFVAVGYSIFGVSDTLARVVSVLFGVGTVILVFLIGSMLFDKTTAAFSSIIIAIGGYDVILSRMALIDSTSIFFFFLSLLFLARWLKLSNPVNLYGSLLFATLATLTKVTSVVSFVIIAVLLAVRPSHRLTTARAKRALIILLPFAVLAGSYLVVNWGATTFGAEWQYSRAFGGNPIGDSSFAPPKTDYYIRQIVAYQGYMFPLVAVVAAVYASWKRSLGDHLTLAATIIPLAFFEFYPLKGFQFILSSIVAMSLLIGRLLGVLIQRGKPALEFLHLQRRRLGRLIPVVGGLTFVALVVTLTVQSATVVEYDSFYLGAREFAYWLRDNTPDTARFVTPLNGLANIIKYYSLRHAYPIFYLGQVNLDPNVDIDKLVANGTIRYVILDDWSTSILRPYSDHAYEVRFRLTQYIASYSGDLIYVHYVAAHDGTLGDIRVPRAWVYQLHKVGGAATS